MAYRVEDIGLNPNYPLFTPAASAMYVRHCSKEGTPNRDALDWYNPDHPTFSWPAALYSAGQAYLDIPVSADRERMLMQRDRNRTILIADSGGYQIGNGTFPKGDVFRTDIHGAEADKIRKKVINWSERFADFSMTMDFPVWAIGGPKYLFNTFNQCLTETYYNCAFIAANRKPGKTRFLNVIQGNKYSEAVKWYQKVKQFNFEGWSFAGQVGANPDITIKMIFHLWRDGNLTADKNWIHILGRSSLPAVWAVNIFHRCIRKYCCPSTQISYDTSSAVQYGIYGHEVVGSVFNSDEMRFETQHIESEDGDPFEYCPIIFRNMVVQMDAINQVNTFSEMSISDLIENSPIQNFYINFKQDVERLFEQASKIGIKHYPIEDIDLAIYKKMID